MLSILFSELNIEKPSLRRGLFLSLNIHFSWASGLRSIEMVDVEHQTVDLLI